MNLPRRVAGALAPALVATLVSACGARIVSLSFPDANGDAATPTDTATAPDATTVDVLPPPPDSPARPESGPEPTPEAGVDAMRETGPEAGRDAGPDAVTVDVPPLADASADVPATAACPADAPGTSTLCGTVTYDWIPANDNVTEGGVKLDYAATQARPARRVLVQALRNGVAVGERYTDDLGRFAIPFIATSPVTIRAVTRSTVSSYARDGIGDDACNGASWDVRVQDNTNNYAIYTLDGSNSYAGRTDGIRLHAPTRHDGTRYTVRAGAPFAILDSILQEFELVCTVVPTVGLPRLDANWSARNTNASGSYTAGQIGTSYYTRRSGVSTLTLLGEEDDDTDEYDDHVIAHETGHYLEDRLYRSDSIGGSHSGGDVLDPRVAFGEGYGNAVSAMAFNDPVYVDTRNARQQGGFSRRMDVAPTGDDRGPWGEHAVQHFLWTLFDGRRAPGGTTQYDRIHAVLSDVHRTSPALTTVLTFAAGYAAAFGADAEGLRTTWTTALDSPWDALCAGTCGSTTPAYEPWDADNDLGQRFGTGGASPRRFPAGAMGTSYPADFWRMYRPLISGINATTAHDQTRFGGYSERSNKWGSQRLYRITPAAPGAVTVAIENPGAGTCSQDLLDVTVFDAGTNVARNTDNGGCPSVTFMAAPGRTYVIAVYAPSNAPIELPSWTLRVTP